MNPLNIADAKAAVAARLAAGAKLNAAAYATAERGATATPMTDAKVVLCNYGEYRVSADFARTLERELNAEREKVGGMTETCLKFLDALNDERARFHDEIVRGQETERNNRELNLKERDHLLDQLATERARMEKIETALKDAISTYFGADKLVTAERIEAWQFAMKEDGK